MSSITPCRRPRHLLALAVAAALAPLAASANPEVRDDAAVLDAVNVVGTGETRQVQALGREELARQPAGSSALKLLGKLPGVHFTSADPWGNYEWSTRLNIRGFNQNQLGFTLDGIPLGDMSYGNHNGLHISRALIAENLGFAEVSQGSGALDTASSSNLGGTVRFASRGPQAERGATLAQTVGSDDTLRTFARYDTGDLDGFSAFLSGAKHDAEKWKGYGAQDSRQVNAQARYADEAWSLGALINTSRRNETDYADLSLESARRLGMDWDNYARDWTRAIRAGFGQFSGGVNSLDDAYYLGRGLRDDNLYALNTDIAIGDGGSFKAQVYRHTNEGQGHWVTPYSPSSATLPLSLRTTEYTIDRGGLTAGFELPFGVHTLSFGLWHEDSDHNLQRNFYFLNADTPPNRGYFYRSPDVRVFEQDFDSRTQVWYLNDRIALMDGRFTIDAGFKALDAEIEAVSRRGTRAQGRIEAKDSFLPQLGLRFEVAPGFELFGSYAENMAAFRAGVNGPFSASQSGFNAIRDTLRPETSTTFEGGLRYGNEGFQSSLTLYRVDFEDRLLTISQCAGIVGCPSVLANVGDVETSGAEAAIDWRLGGGFSLFGSLSWNSSEYASNYLDGTTLVPTDGKTVVDTPEMLANVELRYAADALEARIGMKYTDERFITYVNDSRVPDYWVTDASVSYRFGDLGFAKDLKATLNVTNLFDEDYFASVGTNGFVARDPQGLNYTLVTGAPRQVFLTLEASF
ncbi:TonB-dependent receptor [Silanimonas sp.]|uniref:TonB-dependent receptor n=1 Tax=Silanimonas sp. TaxID=1929290 RepID=UPI0022BD8947|nr:TonB-dependent receptor [Silanimonas sp.]MCZ8165343.1 TonB-dependent receptor [Silanimonas sp.]